MMPLLCQPICCRIYYRCSVMASFAWGQVNLVHPGCILLIIFYQLPASGYLSCHCWRHFSLLWEMLVLWSPSHAVQSFYSKGWVWQWQQHQIATRIAPTRIVTDRIITRTGIVGHRSVCLDVYLHQMLLVLHSEVKNGGIEYMRMRSIHHKERWNLLLR